MNKPKEQKIKRTYRKNELAILLLKEAFERDLRLFSELMLAKGSVMDTAKTDDWTFTVVDTGKTRELFVNVPATPTKK